MNTNLGSKQNQQKFKVKNDKLKFNQIRFYINNFIVKDINFIYLYLKITSFLQNLEF